MKGRNLLISVFMICIISACTILFSSSKTRVYLITADKGILVSDNDGKSWNSCNKGLPDRCTPVRFYTAGKDIYLATFSSGLYRFNKDEWQNISSPLFKRRSIYDKNPGVRKISAFAADPDNPQYLVAATKHSIYKSQDGGNSWNEVPLNGFNNKRNYITALAVSGGVIYAGTSFSGIFEYRNNSFVSSGDGLPGEQYSDTLKFTEQISCLSVKDNRLYAGFYFGGGLYYKNLKDKKFHPIVQSKSSSPDSIIFDIKFSGNTLIITDRTKIFTASDRQSLSQFMEYSEIIKRAENRADTSCLLIVDETGSTPPLCLKTDNPEKMSVNAVSRNRKAVYMSVVSLKKNLEKQIISAKNAGIDTFVIDMKDDFGNIYFLSRSNTAKEINAQKNPLDIQSILKKLNDNEIYAIARIVTFKDQKMYNAYNGKYAVKNRQTGKPWKGAEGEFWVDPFSQFVQNYNIELAKDLEFYGFNEIQFDYIRFPSDGQTGLCDYTYKNDQETYKSEILIDFLKKAKECLTIPVSVDIYGFNSWYHFGNWIGQDMEELSCVVDVICPMVYPSHFGNRFYSSIDKRMRPYRIVLDGGLRGMQMINRSACIRPYLQAFNLLSPTWGPEYINLQVSAAEESGCSGFTLWNANGDYTVPYSAMSNKRKK